MGNRPMKKRTARLVEKIISILEEEGRPLAPGPIAHRIDTETNMRCSVYRVGTALRPLVTRGEIKKTKIEGTHKFTYSLNN